MATTMPQGGTDFKSFVKSFERTAIVLDFGFKECTCEHPSQVLEVGEHQVRVAAINPDTGEADAEGEFPWDSVVSIKLHRSQWDAVNTHHR